MQNQGIRNKPVDRRYLSDQDKSDYNQSGFGPRMQAVKRAKAYRGNLAYQRNKPIKTRTLTPGTGGFGVGLGAQQARNREIGVNKRKSESQRPPVADIYKSIYG